MNKVNFPRKKVYFEKQSNDRLCGVHCLNNLLQGPFFDAVSLSEIALRLDDLESKLFQSDMRSRSENVDDDGNYNIQVLEQALKQHKCETVPLKNQESEKLLREKYDTLEAFIFNSSTHWFAIRKIDNVWFNLNSTNALPGPQIISDFYLSAFIKGTEELGYTNFLIKNLRSLPPLDSVCYSNLLSYQKLVDIEDIINNKPKKQEKSRNSYNLEKNEDDEDEEKKKEEENKFKPFQGKGYSIEDTKKPEVNYEDDEIKQAMELSMNEFIQSLEQQLPKEPEVTDPNAYNIIFRYDGKSFQRRFRGSDYLRDLKNYLQCQIRTYNDIEISESFPRKIYSNENLEVSKSGLSKNQMLNVKLLY